MGKSLNVNLEEVKALYEQKLSDYEIGQRLGVDRKVISRRRKQLGLKTIDRTSSAWKQVKEINQMLQTGKSGREICELLGLSHSTLAKIKKQFGLKGLYETKMSEEDITKAMQMAEAGYMDSEIAKRFGVTDGAIFNHRKNRGVKTQFNYGKISKIDNPKFEELFSKGLSDKKIGDILGLSQDGIYSHRMRHGYFRDSLSISKPKSLTQFQKEVLIGTMLGDSSFKMGRKMLNPSITCAHCVAQKEYCEYKTQIFSSLGAYCKYHKRHTPDKRNGKFYEDYTMFVPSNPKLLDWYHSFYSNKKKVIPFDLLQYFTEVSLAFMYMDDGSKSASGCFIATNCFSKEELILFQKFLKEKFGINTTICKDHSLYVKKESYKKMKTLIEPYICDCMRYKIR